MDDKGLLPILGSDLSCTLDSHDIPQRLEAWKRTTAQATGSMVVDGGRRFTFDREVDVVAIVELAAAEQTCCSFFDFAIGITQDAITLDITGPEAAEPLIQSFAHSE